MSILFSGDFHANAAGELGTITRENLLRLYGNERFDAIKYHIILGDGGFMWPGNQKTDSFNYKVLACRPFPVLCVVGNHEPVLGRDNLTEADIGIGETVYRIQDKPPVAYLKRGKIYTIEGFRFLALGGALSIDKHLRRPNKSWWEKEYWTEEEKRNVFALLETDNSFDYVISHTGPFRINRDVFMIHGMGEDKSDDEVAELNDEIDKKIQCRQWWCGHWHSDYYYVDKGISRLYQYLYRSTQILDRKDGEPVVYGREQSGDASGNGEPGEEG